MKMNHLWMLLVAFIVMVNMTSPVTAQENIPTKNSVVLGFSLENNNITAFESSFESEKIASGYGAFYLSDRIFLQGNLGVGINTKPGISGMYQLNFGAAYITNKNLGNVQPYLNLGMGVTAISYEDKAKDNATGYVIYGGAGVDWFIGPGVSIGGYYSVRYDYRDLQKTGVFNLANAGAVAKFVLF